MNDTLKALKASEPVRLYLYSVLVPVLAVLVAKGVITASDSALYGALASVVLVVPATELVRKAVYSPATVESTLELVADAPIVVEVITDEAELDEYQPRH